MGKLATCSKPAAKDYESLGRRCVAFDTELMADLTRAGGENYAKLCALAYRQCFAAGKFVADDNGQRSSSAKRTTQRLHRTFRCILPDGPAVPAPWPVASQVVHCAL